MSGMRLVGLLMLGLGLLIVWEILNGQSPMDHLRQLIDLFGHQHTAGEQQPMAAPVQQGPQTNLSGRAGGNLAVG